MTPVDISQRAQVGAEAGDEKLVNIQQEIICPGVRWRHGGRTGSRPSEPCMKQSGESGDQSEKLTPHAIITQSCTEGGKESQIGYGTHCVYNHEGGDQRVVVVTGICCRTTVKREGRVKEGGDSVSGSYIRVIPAIWEHTVYVCLHT